MQAKTINHKGYKAQVTEEKNTVSVLNGYTSLAHFDAPAKATRKWVESIVAEYPDADCIIVRRSVRVRYMHHRVMVQCSGTIEKTAFFRKANNWKAEHEVRDNVYSPSLR